MRIKLVYLAFAALTASAAAQAVAGPVDFQPGPQLQSRYQSPTPGKGATNLAKKAVIGSGKTAIDTGGNNAFWTESSDLSDAGLVSQADMLWDSSSKIFYAYSQTTLRCTHGKTINGGILVAIYGKKNYLGKPPGSGWWMVDLQQGQCQAPVAGLYGCKFSPSGQSLACGRAEVDPRINDMSIIEASRF